MDGSSLMDSDANIITHFKRKSKNDESSKTNK